MGAGLGEQLWHAGYQVLPVAGRRDPRILTYWSDVCEDSGGELGQRPGCRAAGGGAVFGERTAIEWQKGSRRTVAVATCLPNTTVLVFTVFPTYNQYLSRLSIFTITFIQLHSQRAHF